MSGDANNRIGLPINVVLGCTFQLCLVAILGISWFSTGSLNPLEVFFDGGVLAKIAEGLLLLFLALLLIAWLQTSRTKDFRCAHCNLGLGDHAELGSAVRCPKCGSWFHQKCLEEMGGDPQSGCNRPDCR